MFKRKSASCCFIILLALLASCSVKEVEPSAVESGGGEYYPIESGNTWIYQVDSTTYTSRFVQSQNQIFTDTFRGRYYIKEQIADSIGLQEGNPFFRIEVYRSTDSLGPWKIDSVWSIQRGKDKILKTENNRPVIKLKFPLQKGVTWDGNQYNTLQDSSKTGWFLVKEFNVNYPFGNNLFPSVLILQKSDSNCLGKNSFYERYLKGIGPAFMMKSSVLYSQEGPDPCGNLPRIESGKERTFKLLRFGKGI
jgi:hypothetical protein